MVEFKEAGLVKSLAGHDKNELYIIISVQGEYVYDIQFIFVVTC